MSLMQIRCVFNFSVVTFFVLAAKNILGLPDYVLGELLSNSNLGGQLIHDIGSDRGLLHESDVDESSVVRFFPRRLNFDQHSIGIPFTSKVFVENLQDDSSLQMVSISGNTVHFHCSFFEDKVIPPKGNTSFDVVFLARQEGAVSNTLYVHTSMGSYKYQVFGRGVENAYRLRPLVGAKVPLNSSYAQMIHIYNPHSYGLQLTEMYSTGGGLHLEMPNGEPNPDTWQIAPFETKAVMKANFLATTEKKHTAYVRIKTNVTETEGSHFILPVEVEVSSAPGIYSPVDLLDFGFTRTNDPAQEVSLHVINAGTKSITIQNIITTPINEAMDISFTTPSPVRIPPNIYHPTEVARLVLDPRKIGDCQRQCSGKIVVKSKNNQHKLVVPYQISLLQGFLGYNQSRTQFYINHELTATSNKVEEKRSFDVVNHFNFTVIMHSVSLPEEAKPYVNVVLNESPVILKPNASQSIAMITFTPSKQLSQLDTYFRLHTNISYFDIRLTAYSGRLEVVFLPEARNYQTVLDFGAIGLREKKSMVFGLVNNCPVEVLIRSWRSNVSTSSLELIGIEEGNATTITGRTEFCNASDDRIENLFLKSKHYALFRLNLDEYSDETRFYGQATIDTQYETLRIPFRGRAIEGSLAGENVFVSNSFPGRVSSQTVRVSSSFSSPLSLKSHFITPSSESRFTFEPSVPPTVHFGENIIGKLYFDPIKMCGLSKTCYSGLETPKEVGHLWLLGLALHPDTGYIDRELHKMDYARWLHTASNAKERTINATLNIETDSGHRLALDASAKLEWPRIICGNKNYLKYPITRIGDTHVKEVMIENPSSQPLLVQAVLLSDYPNSESAIQSLSSYNWWSDSDIKQAETKPKSYRLTEASADSSEHQKIKNLFQVSPAATSVTILMPVGHRTKIAVGFQPQYETHASNKNPESTVKSSTFLLIRNNLTIIDAIHLSGEGGSGLIKIGNQMPGLKSLLSFDLQERHLAKSCGQAGKKAKAGESSIEPQFTVHKSFNLINYGKLPVRVKRFVIGPHAGLSSTSSTRKSTLASVYDKPIGANKILNDLIGKSSCQGLGFKVLNCGDLDLTNSKSVSDGEDGFVVRPNESIKLHIAFTPDFTLAKTMATLTIYTDDDQIDQPLNSTMWDRFKEMGDSLLYGGSRTPLNATRNKKNRRTPVTYSLIATVPKNLLASCQKALPRPYQEFILYASLVVCMMTVVFIAVILSIFDGAKILNCAFYPAIIMSKVAPCPENFKAFDFETIDKAYKEKEKKRDEPGLRNRKGNKTKSLEDTYGTKLCESAQSWASYFTKKLQRRDSSASGGSNGSGGKSTGNNRKSMRNKKTTNGVKDKAVGETPTSAPNRAKKTGQSWFQRFQSDPSTAAPQEKTPETPTPLPVFDHFDENEKLRMRTGKGGKNRGLPIPPVNKEPVVELKSAEVTPEATLELPYKPGKGLIKPVGVKRPGENQMSTFDSEIGYWSNDGTSSNDKSENIIWDSPIGMFNSEQALSEMVKQTAEFAKSNPKEKKQKQSSKGQTQAPRKSPLEAALPVVKAENILENLERPLKTKSPTSWTSPVPQLNPSLQRSITPPSSSSFLFSPPEEVVPRKILSRKPPGLPSPPKTTLFRNPNVPANPSPASSWLNEALYSDPAAPGLQASRLREWTGARDVERLWDPAVTSSRSDTPSQWMSAVGEPVPQQSSPSPPPGWSSRPSPSPPLAAAPGHISPLTDATSSWSSSSPESWVGGILGSSSLQPVVSTAPPSSTAGTFSLFGKSLWSPISPSTTSASTSSWTFTAPDPDAVEGSLAPGAPLNQERR